MVDTLKFLATATQDIATIIDLGFAVPEVIVMLIGLSGGPETIPVVVSGMDIAYNVSGGNALETTFSLFSLIFTASADYLDDGKFGEDTNTSVVTFLTGTMMPDPLGDLAIDGYASGYNHGIFNGFDSIFNGGGLFK